MAKTEFMAIIAGGNFTPCNFIQATLGNIKDRSLREMRDNLLKSEWFCKEYPYCILCESDKYFKEFVEKYKDSPKPLDAYEVFNLY